jgi:hypothetical protein
MSAIGTGCAAAAIAVACGVTAAGAPPPQPAQLGYCLGGSFIQLDEGQPSRDARYANAVPALFLDGIGATCDLVPGYVAAGYTVDGNGKRGGLYPFYVKSDRVPPAQPLPSTPLPPAAAPAPRGLAWGGQRFTSAGQLRNWLKRHGIGWARWARNHPAALAKLERGA